MGFSPFQAVRGFFQDIRNAPEAQYTTRASAPTQIAETEFIDVPEKAHLDDASLKSSTFDISEVEPEKALPPRPTKKEKISGLDYVVKAAGSRWALGFTLLLIVAWAVWGIVDGPTDTWQVILQDVSSIQAYISATLLLRQQANSCRGVLGRICTLISRSESNERMIRSLSPKQRQTLKLNKHMMRADVLARLQTKEDVFDKIANFVAKSVGSLVFLGIYWAGIIVWVAWGFPLQFSDQWQLYVNTATALEITFTTMFLQNIRLQHDKHLDSCIESIDHVDRDIEMQLRRLTGDKQENPLIASIPPTLNRAQKFLDRYAFIVGGSIGVVISCVVFALWLAVGQQLEFDDNWFLIIGTYTGLMGFIDGFVMNNVDHRETALATQHFERLLDQDYKLFGLMDIEMPETPEPAKMSLQLRWGNAIAHWVSTTVASYGSFAVTFGLIITASALQWTETGQLLCNTPTMIVEGFLLIMLLQAHTTADVKRKGVYDDILKRRLVLEGYFASWDDPVYVLPELFDEKSDLKNFNMGDQRRLTISNPKRFTTGW
ncbi:hypothetical protein BJ170DRAFT_697783 [Xylariales sp. AK1849]|nr:hypothetical protein BJ170DRAFT_697783 [Xylariales sp. AK1849]